MPKYKLCERLIEKGYPRDKVKKDINLFFNLMGDIIARGEELNLVRLGRFTIKEKKERPGRNPRTGEACVISSRRVIEFKRSLKMIKRLNGE